MRVISRTAAVALLASRVLGHPTASPHALSRRGIDIEAFRLETVAKYSDVVETADIQLPPSFDTLSYTETAELLVSEVFPKADFRMVPDHYIGNDGIGHVVFKQQVHGIDIDNADFNVNIAEDGTVFSYGNSFYSGPIPAESPLRKRDQVDPVAALKAADSRLNLGISVDAAEAVPESATEHYTIKKSAGALQDPKARLVYFQNPDNTLTLTWRLETDIGDNWLLTYVDAKAPEKISGVVDYVSDATYQVYPWKVQDPTRGTRANIVTDGDASASEFTWLGSGTTRYTTTRGNNAIAQANYEGDSAYLNDYRPTSASLIFSYPFSTATTTPKSYADASITQLFYTSNMYHDLLYKLGFNERAGNFETNNNGQGGLGNDAVILNSQDGSGTNNANFATPVDGQAPRMRMYIWTTSTPSRDSSFDSGVVIHEYTHGLSTRLTGGPANSGCLTAAESGGMGEGWGDFFATAIQLKTTDTRATNVPMGPWISGKANGIRTYQYSTSLTTNPMTYTYANGQTAVHYIGTIWATMLYELLWNLIEKYGITNSDFPVFNGKVPTDGRFLTMQLVLNGMTLQPCNPTFIQARNAILDADTALTGGVNKCAIWKAFAKRGLGNGAARGSGTSDRTASTVIPTGVC